MREDPGYFQVILMEDGDHLMERVPDDHGKLYKHHDNEIFWNDVVTHALDFGYMDFFIWDALTRLARKLDAKTRPILHTLDHQKPLPEDIEEIVLDLISIGNEHHRRHLDDLHHGLATSPYAPGMKFVPNTKHSAMGQLFHEMKTAGPAPGDEWMILSARLTRLGTDVCNIH